jgi:hypothetical protein
LAYAQHGHLKTDQVSRLGCFSCCIVHHAYGKICFLRFSSNVASHYLLIRSQPLQHWTSSESSITLNITATCLRSTITSLRLYLPWCKSVYSKQICQLHHLTCRLVFNVYDGGPRLMDTDAFRRHNEGMSASSGSKGVCSVCSHANNEHNSYTCEAQDCRKRFKVCQTGSHQDAGNGAYVLCKGCPDHPYSCTMFDVQNIKRLY